MLQTENTNIQQDDEYKHLREHILTKLGNTKVTYIICLIKCKCPSCPGIATSAGTGKPTFYF